MDKTQLIIFLVQFVDILRKIIVYAIIGRVLLSWFTMGGMSARGSFTQLLYDVTDPFLNLAKKIPHSIGMIDLSPMIAILGVDLLGQVVVILLSKLA